MSDVYGYVNGHAVKSRDEFIYESRGFKEITSDAELIKFAEKVTGNWYNAGHSRTFISYYLGDYALDEPQASLTKKEYERLKELQKVAIADYEAEQAKYKYELYEGRQMTESEVRMFLDRHVEDTKSQWGENHYYTQQAEEYRDKAISKFKAGEVVCVDSYDFNAAYGNGTGSYSKSLYSDGSIKDSCFGYLD